jgi:hypothetical protein
MSAVRRFIKLSWRERACLGEAVFYLAVARAALLIFPFIQLSPRLGEQHHASAETFATDAQRQETRRVSRAVTTMSRFVPWDSACLAQAIAGKMMLRAR